MAGFDAPRSQPPVHREPARSAPRRRPRAARRSSAAPRPPGGAFLPPLLLVLLAAGLALAAAGCNREQNTVGRDATAKDDEQAADYYHANEENLGHTEVEVRLFDSRIEMPASLPEGHVTFVVVNDSDEPHGFTIEGRGSEKELEKPLDPGATGELQIDLEAGTYHVYCPLSDHRRQGMEHRLEVVH